MKKEEEQHRLQAEAEKQTLDPSSVSGPADEIAKPVFAERNSSATAISPSNSLPAEQIKPQAA